MNKRYQVLKKRIGVSGLLAPQILCCGLLISLLLAGCSLPIQIELPQDATPPPLAAIDTAVPAATPSQTEYHGVCSYVWDHQTLPDVSNALGQALRQANLMGVEAEASAYGKSCVDMGSNGLISFTAKQTDFILNIAIKDATDTKEMGAWIYKVMNVLESFLPGQVPGTIPGQAEMIFQDGSRTVDLTFDQSRARDLISQGLRGTSLFEELSQQ